MRWRGLVLGLVVGAAACDNDGVSSSGTATTSGSGEPVVADFSYEIGLANQGDFCIPVSVTFTDTSTGDPSEWRWEFDDGEVLTEQHPERDHVSYGEEVTLTVTRGSESDSTTQVLDGPVC